MWYLNEYVQVSQANESGEKVIVPAFSTPELIDDIREKVDWNITFWKNADFICRVDSYNKRDDRQKAKHLMDANWLELTSDHEVHHAGDNILEVVKKSIHQWLSHKLKR